VEVSLNGQDFSIAAASSWLSYYNATTIDAVKPLAGSSSGGTVISIGGKGLEFTVATALPKCRFNRNVANPTVSPGVVVQATKLPGLATDRSHAYKCTMPPITTVGYVNIEFALNGQQFVAFSGNGLPSKSFQAYRNDQIKALQPAAGLHTGGETIVLKGVDFRLAPSKGIFRCRFANDPRSVANGGLAWLVTTGTYKDTTSMECLTPAVLAPLDSIGTGRLASLQCASPLPTAL